MLYLITYKTQMSKDTITILKAKKDQIIEKWMQNQSANTTLNDDLIGNQELREQSEEFVTSLLHKLTEENLNNADSGDFDEVMEILYTITISRARQGFSPKETGLFVLFLKEAILEILSQEINTNAALLYTESMKVNRLLDNFSIATFESYISGREEVILRQNNEMTEISTPVIRVWDGILALPIIGTLDSSRTQGVMENLLEAIVETGSSIAILDISGVPAVDSLIAQHLMKTVAATRLMGAECVISGIRPEIAQTIVHLGIDLSNIITKATLASALQYSFQTLKLEVRKQATHIK